MTCLPAKFQSVRKVQRYLLPCHLVTIIKKPETLESTCAQHATLILMNNFGYFRMTLTIHVISTLLTGKSSSHQRKLNVDDYEVGLEIKMDG